MAEQQWLQALREKKELMLFFADIDGLKPINDKLGHALGDQAIVECAEALRKTFRKSDILARIGGDKFAVIASQGPLDQGGVYRNRLQKHFAKINGSGRLPFKLSLSIGVAEFDQKETTSISVLMKRADEDLYKYKTPLSSETKKTS